MKHRLKYLFPFLLLPSLLLGIDPEKESTANRKYSIMYGINYSNYITTDGQGNTGTYLGFYRKREIGRSFGLKYGVTYTIKTPDLLDKKLLSEDGMSLYTSDILGNFHFIEFSSIISYNIVSRQLFRIEPFFGIGYALNIRHAGDVRRKSVIESDDHQPFESYDYRYADFSPFPLHRNKGYIYHGGIEIEKGRFIIDLFYSYHLFYLMVAESRVSLGDPGEKLHSVALVFGIGI